MIHFFEELRQRNELLYFFGLICLILAAVCLGLMKWTNIQVLGVHAFLKPFKFFLSTSIFVWTMAWYAHYLSNQSPVWYYSIGMIVLFTIEDGYILIQAARGQTSHFNLSDGFTRSMWAMMVVSAIGISLWTMVLAYMFFSDPLPQLPVYYAWAIRIALTIFVIFSLEGMAMGARMAHSVGGMDGSEGLAVVNWSKRYGDLRVAHFLGMHALQIIPVISFYVLRTVTMTTVLAIVYFVVTLSTFVQALQGKPILRI